MQNLPLQRRQTAVRNALIGFMAAQAQAQAEATKAAHGPETSTRRAARTSTIPWPQAGVHAGAVRRGSRHARQKGTTSIAQIAKATGVKRPTVYRLKTDPAAAEAALATWRM